MKLTVATISQIDKNVRTLRELVDRHRPPVTTDGGPEYVRFEAAVSQLEDVAAALLKVECRITAG